MRMMNLEAIDPRPHIRSNMRVRTLGFSVTNKHVTNPHQSQETKYDPFGKIIKQNNLMNIKEISIPKNDKK